MTKIPETKGSGAMGRKPDGEGMETTPNRDRAAPWFAASDGRYVASRSKISEPMEKPDVQEDEGETEQCFHEFVLNQGTEEGKKHYQNRDDEDDIEPFIVTGFGEQATPKIRPGVVDVLRTHFSTISFLGGTIGLMGIEVLVAWALRLDPDSVSFPFLAAHALVYAESVLLWLPSLTWWRRTPRRSGPDPLVDNRSALSVGRWLLLAVFLSVASVPAAEARCSFIMVIGLCTGFCAALADIAATEAWLQARESRS